MRIQFRYQQLMDKVLVLIGILIMPVLGCNTFDTITNPNSVTRSLQIITNSNQDVGIGIWTKFFPSVTKFDTPFSEQERMLIFLQSNPTISEYYVIYSIKYDQALGILYHEAYLYIGGSFQVFSLPIDAGLSLQRWVFFYLCRKQTDLKYSIFTYFFDEREYTQMANGINGNWPQQVYFFYRIGKTLNTQNQFNPKLEHSFSVFRGLISDIYFSNTAGSYFDNIIDFVAFIESLVCATPNPCPVKKVVDLLTPVTVFDGHEFVSKQLISSQSRYMLTGWAKVRPLDLESEYTSLLMRMTINPNYQDNKKTGDRVFYLKYFQHIQPDLNGFYFSTYSVQPDNMSDDYSSMPTDEWSEKSAFYESALTQWHFFTFQYGLSNPAQNAKLEVFYAYQQTTKTKLFQYREQLPDQTYYILIGGDKLSQGGLFRGELANMQFSFCFTTDQTPTRPCHYSCAQCLGPTMQQCNLCADPTSSNRELISSTGQCMCKPDFVEREGQQSCKSSSSVFDFVKIDEIESATMCQYGEFSVNGKFCIPCPQGLQADGYFCADCWMNQRSWYLQPRCTFDYLLDSPNSSQTFQRRVRAKKDEIYFFLDQVNRKLVPCEGCSYDYGQDGKSVCKPCYKPNEVGFCVRYLNNCKECNNLTQSCIVCDDGYAWNQGTCVSCPPHCLNCIFDNGLRKAVCQTCEDRFGLSEGECKLCGQYCALCERQVYENVSFMKCYLCEDTKQYYISFDGENCHQNVQPNCLTAADLRRRGYYYETSLNNMYAPSQSNDYQTICLRCAPGFLYRVGMNECTPSTNYDETIIDRNSYIFNLGKNTNPSLSQLCPKKCNRCISPYILDKIYCITCEFGYFSHKFSGVCNSCPANLNCRSCSHQNVKYKDDWKWDIKGAFYYNVGQGGGFPNYNIAVETRNIADNMVLCTSCKLNYIFYQGYCIKGCHSSCKTCVIVNYQSQCVECKSTLQGQLQSVENGQCLACPHNCKVCRSYTLEEGKLINFYFDTQASPYRSFSNQCLKAFSEPHLYYNWDLTQFTQCLTLQKPCFKRAEVEFQTYCSEQMFDTARLGAADTEAFDKRNVKLSTAFNNKQGKSFPQIENEEFFQIMNQKQINYLKITLNLIYDSQGKCQFNPFSKIATSIRSNIFTAQIVELIIVGNRNLEVLLNNEIEFSKIDKIKLQNLRFSHTDHAALIFSSQQTQKIQLENLSIKGNTVTPKKLQFKFANLKEFEISNIELSDLAIENTSGIFSYFWEKVNVEEFNFKLSKMQIDGCLFSNTNVILLTTGISSINQSLKLLSLNIQNSQFIASALIQSTSRLQSFSPQIQLSLTSLLMQDLQISQATFINLFGFSCQVDQVLIEKVQLTSSIIFEVQIFKLNSIQLTANKIIDSCFLYSVSSDALAFDNALVGLTFKFNTYSNGLSFIRYQQRSQKLLMSDLVLKSNSLILTTQSKGQPILASISLIFLEADQIVVQSVTIIRGQGFPELTIKNVGVLSITNLYITLDKTFGVETIHSQFSCLDQTLIEQFYTTFMFLYAVKTIQIERLQIIGLISINQPLVQIKSLDQYTVVQEESILISDSVFSQNDLIATKLGVQQSIVAFYSLQNQKISIVQTVFKNNLQNSYVQDITQKSASTIFISCPNAEVLITELKMGNCLITNNQGSNMIVQAKSLRLRKSKFEFLNQLVYSDLKASLFWGSGVENFYEENLASILSINSEGGVGYFNVEKLELSEIFVKNTSGMNGGAFYIEVKDQGTIEIIDCTFLDSRAVLNQEADSYGGAIFISSQPALLNLTISNCEFQNTLSRKLGGALYIIPSSTFNLIKIFKTKVQNSYSFQGSFLYLASLTTQKSNTLFIDIDGLSVNNFRFSSFLEKISRLTSQEVDFFSQSYLIDLQGGHLTLSNTRLTALELNGLLKCTGIHELIIREILITNLLLLAQPLFYVKPLQGYNGRILFSGIQLFNFSEKTWEQSNIAPPPILEPQRFYCQKSFEKPSALQLFYTVDNQRLNLNYNLQQIMMNRNGIQAIIVIQDLTSKWFLEILRLKISNVRCSLCQNGLMSIKGLNLSRGQTVIKIQNSYFGHNSCGIEGCINIGQTGNGASKRMLAQLDKVYSQQQTLEIQGSKFTHNMAQFGGCLYLSKIDVLVVQSVFNENQASDAGGAVYFIRSSNKETLLLVESELTNNIASYGGALYISDYNLNRPDLMDILLYGNLAKDFGSNTVQPPYQLTVTLNKGTDLLAIKQLQTDVEVRLDQVEMPQGQKILFPSGQALRKYQYFNQETKSYENANLSLRVIPLNSQGQRMKQLFGTQCKLDSRIVGLTDPTGKNAGPFSNFYTNLETIPFNVSSQDYNLDDLIVKFSPQLRSESALQLRFQCDSIKIPKFDIDPPYLLREYATNYSLLMNVQTFYCQQGEFIQVENNISICEICDSTQDQYSVYPSEGCRLKDQNTMLNVTSARVQLRQGYWRPTENNVLIENCRNLEENCLGGWDSGDSSCFNGHIGALCEQCDLYNIRGDGPFSVSMIYKCGSCNDVGDNITKLVSISVWTIISIIMSVNSTLDANLLVALGKKFKKIGIQVNPRSGISGILIKVFTNYMQILSTIATFQLKLPSALTASVTSVGSPMEAMSYSLDCFIIALAKDFNIEIIYFRIIWGFIMPVIYILAYFILQGLLIIVKALKPNLGIISTTFVYMYIYLQPTIIGGLASLISYREISGIIWIQGNVSYRYNTSQHQSWLLFFLVPFITLFAAIIPIVMLLELYWKRDSLDQFSIRQKWGYLYNEYTNKSFFWEIVKIYQKSLIIIFMTFYEDVIVVKAAMIFLIVFIYQLLSKATKPYSIAFLNEFDQDSSIVCGLSIVMGITIYAANLTNNQEIIWPFYIILIGGNGIFMGRLLLELIKSQLEQNQDALDKIRDKLNEKLPSLSKCQLLQKYLLQNRRNQRLRVESKFRLIKQYLKRLACDRILIIKNEEQVRVSNFAFILCQQNQTSRLFQYFRATFSCGLFGNRNN